MLLYSKWHIHVLLLVFMAFSFLYPFFVIILMIYVIYVRKSLHKKCAVIIILLFSLNFIYMNYHIKTIDDNAKIVEVEKNLHTHKYTITYRFKKYEFNSNDFFEVGDLVYIKATVERFRKQTIDAGFNAYAYKISRNIHGKLKVEKISQTSSGFHINKLKTRLLGSDVSLLTFLLDNSLSLEENHLDYLFKLSGISLYILENWIKKMGFHLNISNRNQTIVNIIIFGFVWFINPSVVTTIFILNIVIPFIFDLCGFYYIKLDIRSITCLIMLICAPYLIYHQGFIITYLIIFFYELSNCNEKLKTYMAPILLIPFFILWQHEISILLWLLSPFMVKIIKKYVIHFVLFMSLFPYLPIDKIFNKVLDILSTITSHFNLTIRLPTMSIFYMVIYYTLCIWVFSRHSHMRLVILVFALSLHYTVNQLYQPDFIYFLDVGQGDSAIIRYQRKIIVVDAYQYVEKTLKSKGIKRIDYLILTHSDLDHVKEAQQLIDTFDVVNVYINAYNDYALNHGNIIVVGNTYLPMVECVQITFLAPLKVFDNANDHSLVFEIKMSDITILFTGDISFHVEQYLIDTYPLLSVDILKVAHHGSITSSSINFIKHVRPSIAVISSSIDNKYQHPHQDILDRFKDNGTHVYQTRYHGSVKVLFNQGKPEIILGNKPY